VDEDVWDRVESDGDQTLRARCPHFARCFYYEARRAAAGAHVIVVNHALLMRDLALRAEDAAILPDYRRVILDEGHHLEEAATGAGSCRLSEAAIGRALAPLGSRRGRPGALERIARKWRPLADQAGLVAESAAMVRNLAATGFSALEAEVDTAVRVRERPLRAQWFQELATELGDLAGRLGALAEEVGERKPGVTEAQPLLDVARAHRRIQEAAATASAFLEPVDGEVRWLEPSPRTHAITAVRAPLDVAPWVQARLAEPMHGVVLTSATLAVRNSPEHLLTRTGLRGAAFQAWPSPFAFRDQAVLALPRDLPAPESGEFLPRVGAFCVEAIRASGGGAFVLCTSYDAVRQLGAALRESLGARHRVLVQGRGPKAQLLARFREDRAAVLVATDSFWEGVSVRGEGLRLVILPRLPFRMPHEPLAQARAESLAARGLDPFRALTLPEAVLKLRQGFGRLIRGHSDRGAVAILDRRIHDAWYGRVFLSSLPDARRVVGPERAVLDALRGLYAGPR
jgi:ATP-dependent DNA helicase DinG